MPCSHSLEVGATVPSASRRACRKNSGGGCAQRFLRVWLMASRRAQTSVSVNCWQKSPAVVESHALHEANVF